MSQCQRCRAENDPGSRFCVSCGNPLAPAGQGSGNAPSPARQLETWQPPPHAASAASVQVPAATSDGPPSSGFAFAETAPPLSDSDESRAMRAAISSSPPANPSVPPEASAPMPYPSAVPANVPPGKDPLSVPPDAPPVLVGFLASYEGADLGQSWDIQQGRNLVGRKGASPEIRVGIPHPTTSSRHAILHACAHPGRVMLEDCGSTNGTYVNDVQLSAGRAHEVTDGDRVRFGLFTAVIKII